jgi:hypothetical protein
MRLWLSVRLPFTPLRVGTSVGGRRRRPVDGSPIAGYVVLCGLGLLLVGAVAHSWAQVWPWLIAGVLVFVGHHLLKAHRNPQPLSNTVEDRAAKVKACPPCRDAIARARTSGTWERCTKCRTPWRIRTPNQAAVSDRR